MTEVPEHLLRRSRARRTGLRPNGTIPPDEVITPEQVIPQAEEPWGTASEQPDENDGFSNVKFGRKRLVPSILLDMLVAIPVSLPIAFVAWFLIEFIFGLTQAGYVAYERATYIVIVTIAIVLNLIAEVGITLHARRIKAPRKAVAVAIKQRYDKRFPGWKEWSGDELLSQLRRDAILKPAVDQLAEALASALRQKRR